MDWGTLSISKTHIIRIDPGEDVLLCIKHFLQESGVQQAMVLGGYGTLASHHLSRVKDNRLPVDKTFARGYGGIEILSMNGLIVKGDPHIHITLSTPAGGYGGHLEEGCITYLLCEVMLGEVQGVELARETVDVDVKNIGKGPVPRLVFGE